MPRELLRGVKSLYACEKIHTHYILDVSPKTKAAPWLDIWKNLKSKKIEWVASLRQRGCILISGRGITFSIHHTHTHTHTEAHFTPHLLTFSWAPSPLSVQWQYTWLRHSQLLCVCRSCIIACRGLLAHGVGVPAMNRAPASKHKTWAEYTRRHLLSYFFAKHMLNHPWHAPPMPAGASRVQPLSPQVRPLQLWFLG